MPNSRKTIGHGVAAGKGESLTLDEIAEFINNAKAAGIPGDTCPTAAVGLSGKVRTLSVDLRAKDEA